MGADDGEEREADVGHGAGDGADVKRITRRDEDDVDAVALGLVQHRSEQEMIVFGGIATLHSTDDDELEFD